VLNEDAFSFSKVFVQDSELGFHLEAIRPFNSN
jgi:hypothetical protein